ncbi:MAG: hypothetical protein A2284_09575 [Deltaproteobacteria bacterium RIFOXYA12_FULL_61_11]|nr:MAG: hypothetical protein A2284_09575 [Deltaproteobacteria bacterium RIFOXYA12_FULL_61_11]
MSHSLPLLFLLLTITLQAAEQPSATAFLKAESDSLRALLAKSKEPKAFLERSRTLFDFAELGRRVLAPEGTAVTKPDLEAFLERFPRLIELSYLHRAERSIRDYPVTFLEEHDQSGDSVVKVSTSTGKRTIEIILFCARPSGVWRIINLEYDTVNLLELYRKQFHRILAKHGMKGLLSRIDTKIVALEKQQRAGR